MIIRRSILSLAAVLAVALLANTPAFAQQAVRADVPFAFEAAGQQFAPGTYLIQHAALNGVLMLTSEDGRRIMMMTHRGSHNANGGLAFAFSRVAGGRSLAAVWMEPNAPSHEFSKAKKSRSGQRLEVAAR